MGGFTDRKETFKGVHDEIFARALVLDNGTAALVIIGSDLTDVDADMTRKLSERVDIRAGGTFRSIHSSAQDILFNPTGVGTPATGIPAPIDYVAIFWQRSRSRTSLPRWMGLGRVGLACVAKMLAWVKMPPR